MRKFFDNIVGLMVAVAFCVFAGSILGLIFSVILDFIYKISQ